MGGGRGGHPKRDRGEVVLRIVGGGRGGGEGREVVLQSVVGGRWSSKEWLGLGFEGKRCRGDQTSQRVGRLRLGGMTNPAGRLSITMRRRSGGNELSCDVAHHRTALTISCSSPQCAAWYARYGSQ